MAAHCDDKHLSAGGSGSNLLTLFTETETARVYLLRKALPLIFEEAFKDLKDTSQILEPVDIWGLRVDPRPNCEDKLDPRIDVVLVKFLRAQ